MKSRLLKDALGSMLHQFFTQQAKTHEAEDDLVATLWRAVSHYRQTGEFSMAAIVCPQYSSDYTQVLSGTSVTAHRAISMYRSLKSYLKQHISYGSKVHFRTLLFDREHRQFELMGVSLHEAVMCMDGSVREIASRLRKTGVLPECFKSDRLVGDEWESEWMRLFSMGSSYLENNSHDSRQPFLHPDKVFGGLRDFYRRVMNTDDVMAHRKMFDTEEGPGYLAAGHLLRKKFGAHTIQVDLGSNIELARMNLFQPPGEELTKHPALIRIRDPHMFDPR